MTAKSQTKDGKDSVRGHGFVCRGLDEGGMDRRVIYGDKTYTAKICKEYKVAEVTRMQGRHKKN